MSTKRTRVVQGVAVAAIVMLFTAGSFAAESAFAIAPILRPRGGRSRRPAPVAAVLEFGNRLPRRPVLRARGRRRAADGQAAVRAGGSSLAHQRHGRDDVRSGQRLPCRRRRPPHRADQGLAHSLQKARGTLSQERRAARDQLQAGRSGHVLVFRRGALLSRSAGRDHLPACGVLAGIRPQAGRRELARHIGEVEGPSAAADLPHR